MTRPSCGALAEHRCERGEFGAGDGELRGGLDRDPAASFSDSMR